MAKQLFNEEQAKRIDKYIWSTWTAIGYDAEELCEGNNKIALELCFDAGRIEIDMDGKEDQFPEWKDDSSAIEEVIRKNGFKSILNFFNKRIRLV